MTAAGPWSVKGIDPKAREIAKDLARRSGMTLGEWLNQMIIDGGEPEVVVPEPPPETRRRALDELYREARATRSNSPLQMVGETAEVARVARTLNDLALRMEAAEQRSGLAISGVDQSVMGVLSRLDAIERESGLIHMRSEGASADVRAAQLRIADKLQRIEHEEGARAEAFKTLETTLNRVADQMQRGHAMAQSASDEVRQAEERLSKRLETVETAAAHAPDAYADAEKVDVVLSRMAERIDRAETRTTAAVQSLQTSFAGLDARLRGTEARVGGPTTAEVEGRFQSLAQELSKRVETTRSDLAEQLRTAADGRFEAMDATLREMRGQVEQAEKRSAQTIDRIGREVIRVAHGLGERVVSLEAAGAAHAKEMDARLAEVETRNAAAVESVGNDVARIADTVESRLRHADGAQAEALERLGEEIARIAERLTDRISNSDRRAAEAIDEVTDRVARLGEHMDARHERNAGDLADRIRQSDERTAKLLDEAREKLEHSLAARVEPAPPPASKASKSPPVMSNADPFGLAPPAEEDFSAFDPGRPSAYEPAPAFEHTPAYGERLSAWEPAYVSPSVAAPPKLTLEAAAPPPVDFHADHLGDHADPFSDRASMSDGVSPFDPEDDFIEVSAHVPPPSDEAPSFLSHDFATEPATPASFNPVFAPQVEASAALSDPDPLFGGFSVNDFSPAPEAAPVPGQMSTREMLEAARQAARTAGGRADSPGVAPERTAGRAPRPFGLTLPGRRKKEGAPTLRTIALASVTAGAITTAAVGAYMLGGVSHDGVVDTSHTPDLAAAAPTTAPNLAVALTPASASDHRLDIPVETTAAKAASSPTVKAAGSVAASPKSVGAQASSGVVIASPHALYATAVNRIETGDLTAVADLRSAAAQGDVGAQFYLARLYEAGGAGLAKNLTEARRWTQKAAEGGDPLAMYNLASYAYAGDGGPKDVPVAVTWFRQAAGHGVVNAQYNLAQLYEKGYGVPQDLAQAYVWYTAAATAGDGGAKTAAAALRPRLSSTALIDADRRVSVLHDQLAADATSGATRTAAAKPTP